MQYAAEGASVTEIIEGGASKLKCQTESKKNILYFIIMQVFAKVVE